MTSEDRFRYVLMLVLLVMVSIGGFHRLKARTGEKLDRRQEGLFMLIALRVIALAGTVALAAYLANPASVTFSALPLPDWLRWAGVGLSCVALGLLFWTLRTLGRNLTDTVVTRKRHTLVTTGPYRWVRHPFYTCAALISLAIFLISANAAILVAGALIFLLLALRNRVEEDNLLSRFGEDYRSYRDRTGRFLPRV